MTTDPDDATPGVDLGAGQPEFDPYRFGLPDHPIDPEFAPPGYEPPPSHRIHPSAPAPPAPAPYGTPPFYGPGQPPPPGYPYGPPPPYGPGHPYGPPPPYGPGHPYGPASPYGRPYVPPEVVARSAVRRARLALAFGILSIALFDLAFFDVILIGLAATFGGLALAAAGRLAPPQDAATGRTPDLHQASPLPDLESATRVIRRTAWSAIACCVIGAVLAAGMSVKLVRAIDQCGGLSAYKSSSRSDFTDCVQRKL